MNAALLLALGSKRRIQATLRQSKAGGFATASGTSTASATTTAVGFDSATLSGSLLICVVQVSGTYTGTAVQPLITAVTTSGFSWTGIPQGWAISGQSGKCAIYYITNASAMATSTHTTVSAEQIKSPSGNPQVWVEFQLYELVINGTLDTDQTGSGSSSIPSTTNLTTTENDVVLVAVNAEGTTGVAGSGYTLGIDSSHQNSGVVGQLQYNLGINAGSVPTAFGTSETNWSAVAAAFKI